MKRMINTLIRVGAIAIPTFGDFTDYQSTIAQLNISLQPAPNLDHLTSMFCYIYLKR
jgi:hypothetical protein